MKTIEVENLEKANHSCQEWNRQHHRAALFMAVPLIFGFLAARIAPPTVGNISMAVSSAMAFSLGVCLIPNDFRSRSGSLTPAMGLVAALWIAALVTAVVTLLG